MSTAPLSDISSEFASLTPAQQSQVLTFIRDLKTESEIYRERRRKALLELAGSISPEDAALMRSAIEADCERVDADEW